MRKLFSILLIILLLFNVLGYYGLFLGLRYKSAQDMVQRLNDDDYTDAETITLKMPLAVPYHADTDEYERVDGEIEHQGEFYRLVKQRLSNDTLYIVCIIDHQSKHIKQALTNYVKTFTDKPVDAKQNMKTFPGFIKDYLSAEIVVLSCTEGWNHSILFHQTKDLIPHLYLSITTPPPKA